MQARVLTLPRGRRGVRVRRAWRQSVQRHLERVPAAQVHDHALLLARAERLRVFGVELWLMLMGVAWPLLAFSVAWSVRPHLAMPALGLAVVLSVMLFSERQMERDVELEAAAERVRAQAGVQSGSVQSGR